MSPTSRLLARIDLSIGYLAILVGLTLCVIAVLG